MISALNNTTALVGPEAFSHQETPTQLGKACHFHPHSSYLAWRCKVMEFEFTKAR